MSVGAAAVLLIQNDWNSILSDVGAEAWVSCKAKDSPGIHGKIRTVRGFPDTPSFTVSEGFEVDKVTSTSITIKHHNCPYTTVFVAPERTISNIHKGSIAALDVNPESLAVSFSSKDHLLVWDTRTEETKVYLKGHVFEVYKCRFFPSGKVVLSGGSDMTLRIWCPYTGQCPKVLKGHTMAVTDFGFINRGKNILSTSKDGKVKLWNCADGTCIADITSVSSSINCCKVIEAPSFLNLPSSQVQKSAKEIDTDNKLVIIGCEDGTVECVAIASRKSVFTLNVESAVNCLCILDSNYLVLGCQNGQIFVYDFQNLDNRKMWHESNSSVLSILSIRDIGFFASRADGSVVFTPLNGGSNRISLTGPNCDPVYDVASDGKYIYTCSRDGSVRVYVVQNLLNSVL